jgi:hypothetical protein
MNPNKLKKTSLPAPELAVLTHLPRTLGKISLNLYFLLP